MALPTGRYPVVLLWAVRRPSGKGWDIEFLLTETGEREQAFVFNKDIGFVVAKGAMMLRGGRFQPGVPEAEQPIVMLSLKFSPKFGSTHVTGSASTGGFLKIDTRYNGRTFEAVEF